MKKFGFTLAELLVSLTVIAIAATMMASLSGNLMPDKNKVKVLKFHSAISNALESMFNNENLYHPGQRIENNLVVASCEGVECFYGDENEFENFRGHLFERVPESFMGGTWNIVDNEDGNYTITLDVNPNNNGQTSYRADVNVRDIDSFVLNLDRYGELTPGDNLTRAYLENPLNLKSRKEDLARANNIDGGAKSETTEQTDDDNNEKKTEYTEQTDDDDANKKTKDTEAKRTNP